GNGVHQCDAEEFCTFAEVFAQLVPLGQRIWHSGDDVSDQSGQITIDEECANNEDAGQGEQTSHEDLGDPAGIIEDEGEWTDEVEGRPRGGRRRRHDGHASASVTATWKKTRTSKLLPDDLGRTA